jgi:multiple sugar transport system substrate-binding protein
MRRWIETLLLTLSALVSGTQAQAQAQAATQPITLRHLLWDAAQRPAIQQCAADFERHHPGVRVRVQQQGWDDYWSTLSTGFISDTAPDVFTNHLQKFPEHVENGLLVDLAPLIARDGVAVDQFMPGLYANWGRDGRQYALPADWDTVALLVNLDLARRAGLGEAQLRSLDWNPRDGGSFGRAIALMAQDEAGRNALHPAYDKGHVKVYGYQTPSAGGMMGQTEWSHFALSNGFRFQDRPWSSELHYDDPKLAETVAWLATLPARGISTTPRTLGKLGAESLFISGRVAAVPVGSWMTGHINRHVKFPHAWVPLPLGPGGQRASMLNGLGYAIWIGSPHREAAWQWVRHLASADCQRLVARAGVVYPSLKGMAEIALQVQRAAGAEAGVFLDAAVGLTFPPPIAPHAAEINDRLDGAMEAILFAGKPAGPTLKQAQQRVRLLLARP